MGGWGGREQARPGAVSWQVSSGLGAEGTVKGESERGRGRVQDLQGRMVPPPNQSQAGGTFLPAGWELGSIGHSPLLTWQPPPPCPGNL